jgi:DNA-binding winged helix-turn-helix (wHTH) protein/Tfp pilus assembly protein PilF/TolB-like protein
MHDPSRWSFPLIPMSRRKFAFAEFTFDSETGTLTRKNRGSRLPEQTARLLEVLLERANTLVTREELRQTLWPGEEFVDYDQGINVAVNRLRNALHDDPRNPQFLKTIPKRGYSFRGDVTVLPLEPPRLERSLSHVSIALPVTPLLEPLPDPPLTLLPRAPLPVPESPVTAIQPVQIVVAAPRRRWIWAAAVLGVMALAGTTWIIGTRSRKPAPHILRVGIAPLQVQNDPQAGDLGNSFRLQLSDALSRLPSVQVRAAGSFESTRVNGLDIPQLSRELNLDDLLLGTIVRQGNEYDLKFELVRAADAIHLASFEYSGTKQDLPALRDRLQQDIFYYLQSGTTSVQAVNGSTNDAQAYQLYLQGVYHTFSRSPDSLRQSLAEFHQAIARDPNFAAAYSGLATSYLKLSSFDSDPRDGLLSKAQESAQHAIRLDPLLAQAHAVLGCIAYKQDRNFARGEAELRNAIQIDPAQAEYRNWLAVLLVEEGRFDESIEQLRFAQTNDPFLPTVYAMQGLVGVYARQNTFALESAKKYVDLLPNLPITHNTLAWVDFETGHYEEAVKEWRYMAVLQNDPARIDLEDKGMAVLKSQGIHAYAQLRLDAIRSKRGVSQANDFSPAEWSVCAGKHEQALAELQRLTASQDPYMLHVAVDPLYDSFHGDPRFLALVAKTGLAVPPSLQNVNSHLCE